MIKNLRTLCFLDSFAAALISFIRPIFCTTPHLLQFLHPRLTYLQRERLPDGKANASNSLLTVPTLGRPAF